MKKYFLTAIFFTMFLTSCEPKKEVAQDKSKVRTIEIGVIPGALKYNVTSFEVITGEKVKIVFTNNGLMPHNLLITKANKVDAVIVAAMTAGLEKNYIPGKNVLEAIKILQVKESYKLKFKTPAVGEYIFVCTFVQTILIRSGPRKMNHLRNSIHLCVFYKDFT